MKSFFILTSAQLEVISKEGLSDWQFIRRRKHIARCRKQNLRRWCCFIEYVLLFANDSQVLMGWSSIESLKGGYATLNSEIYLFLLKYREKYVRFNYWLRCLDVNNHLFWRWGKHEPATKNMICLWHTVIIIRSVQHVLDYLVGHTWLFSVLPPCLCSGYTPGGIIWGTRYQTRVGHIEVKCPTHYLLGIS